MWHLVKDINSPVSREAPINAMLILKEKRENTNSRTEMAIVNFGPLWGCVGNNAPGQYAKGARETPMYTLYH